VLWSLARQPRRWTALTLVLLALGVIWAAASRLPGAGAAPGAPPPSPREGFSAPDFALEQLGGGRVTLSELRGQVVVVNLWASWCPPCRAEMPALDRVYRAYRDQGLVVLGVNLTSQDDEATAIDFVEELGLSFPILFDRSGEVNRRYRPPGLPGTYFVDRGGVIRTVIIGGPMSEALIRSKVEPLLGEGP
jgi:thiol-disulfide isomerase/thioredoxin